MRLQERESSTFSRILNETQKEVLHIQVIADLNGNTDYLGEFSFKSYHPLTSIILYCTECGRTVAKLFARAEGYTRPRWDARSIICSRCGGDDTILHYPLFETDTVYERIKLTDKLLAYEMEAVLSRGDKRNEINYAAQYGEKL